MSFIDEAKIYVKAGDGGNGCVSLRKEKFVEFGGPDGGDGGRGGSIIFETHQNINTLIAYRYTQHFKAMCGESGKGKNKSGHSGQDIILPVPVGTQVFADDKTTLLADLSGLEQSVVLLSGGRGGMGNARFKSSVNQTPRYAMKGEKGAELAIWLRLKLLSDIGLVGLPNAGKSTFLSVVSAARPKIADYPFTTLHPHLGVVDIADNSFVIADLPGLIAGASQGHGLGHRFLRHVERCKILLHLIDVTIDNLSEAYDTIQNELISYNPALGSKPEIILLNKCDLITAEEAAVKRAHLLNNFPTKTVYLCSGVSKIGLNSILLDLLQLIRISSQT